MDANPVIFDISSDEEGEVGAESNGDNYDWISQLLRDAEGEAESDDVMVLGEVSSRFVNPTNMCNSGMKSKDDVDDDCVVLDGDPDKPTSVVNGSPSGSDELLVVGEKGQIACRDYPHSRHTCFIFPFSSTPHEKLCDLCHCYVCDIPAPCVHWGTGISKTDHCHATDEEQRWKILRENVKQETEVPLPLPKLPDSSFNVRCTGLEPNLFTQNQVARPFSVRPCSSATNFPVANIITQTRNERTGNYFPRNKPQPRVVSRELLGTRINNTIRRDEVPKHRVLAPQFVSSTTVFKRSGYSSQISRSSPLTVSPKVYRQPVHCSNTNTVPAQSQVYNQPVHFLNDTQYFDQNNNQQNVADLNFAWVDDTNVSNQQSSLENMGHKSAEPTYDPPRVSELNPLATPSSSYLELENWLLDNQPETGGSELGCSMPSKANMLPPDPDAGLPLFDFETAWDSLAHL